MIEWLSTNNNWLSALAAIAALVLFVFGLVKWVLPKKPQEVVVTNPPRVEPSITPSPIPASSAGKKLDVEDFLKIQRELKADLVAQQSSTDDAETKARLQARIAELEKRIAEPDDALAEAQKRIADLEALLEREGNEIGAERLDAARAALEKGDYSIADEIFAEIEAREQLAVQRAARAAFGRGEVAEAEVRWLDAADHYARAAELAPDFSSLFEAEMFAWRAGRYGRAIEFGKRLIALPDLTLEQRSSALNSHAETLKAAGLYDEAEPLFRESLEITRETLGSRHPETAIRLSNLADLLRTKGQYEEAEPLHREALEITRETLGVRHPATAIRLNNLAELLCATDRHDEAEPLYREALEIGRQTLGDRHPDYATRLNNVAELLRETGRYDEAEPLHREALEITRETLGDRHPQTALRLNNLAALLSATGRSNEVEPLYREALAIDRETLGDRHPDTAIDLNNLAELLRAAGRHNEAEPPYREALAVLDACLGPDHPRTKLVCGNLATFLSTRE